MTTTPTDRLPFVTMLTRLEAAFLAEFDQRLEDSEFCSLSFAHARNVLRHLGTEPRRASDLVEAAGVTKQAISQQVAQLERAGLVRCETDPADQRARLVVLTEPGERALELVRDTFVEIEQAWSERLGADQFDALHEGLATLLGHTDASDEPDTAC